MGSILHAHAKTTPRIRKDIQKFLESASKLAKRFNLNVKIVLKWKKIARIEEGKSLMDQKNSGDHTKNAYNKKVSPDKITHLLKSVNHDKISHSSHPYCITKKVKSL